ncbi:hypothetical protein Bhyg_05871 [Pseudolycoriella hygida]|uniref:Uncharacterized protein n=1 Tax=Pseudolycoriella hygida TaxID=35572 RepID=A0A9Q0MZI3_9DIPT|nr:hypothetical protein Bhyg_05871 [Pseudolycoriella hygida]
MSFAGGERLAFANRVLDSLKNVTQLNSTPTIKPNKVWSENIGTLNALAIFINKKRISDAICGLYKY